MPVTTQKQASITLSAKQATAIGEIAAGLPKSIPAITLEETNFRSTVAVVTTRGSTMVTHDGELHKLGRGA